MALRKSPISNMSSVISIRWRSLEWMCASGSNLLSLAAKIRQFAYGTMPTVHSRLCQVCSQMKLWLLHSIQVVSMLSVLY